MFYEGEPLSLLSPSKVHRRHRSAVRVTNSQVHLSRRFEGAVTQYLTRQRRQPQTVTGGDCHGWQQSLVVTATGGDSHGW